MLKDNGPIRFSKGLVSTVGAAYLIGLFVAGPLTNFVPLGPVNTGTSLLYSLGSFLSFTGALYLLGPLRKPVAFSAFVTVALSFLVLVKAAFDTNPSSQRIHEAAIFLPGAWPFLFFIQIKGSEIRQRYFEILKWGLFALCVFSIFQSIFARSLPLSLFVLRGDATFSVGDDGVLRPTGLVGDPIIFSSILVFASAYFFSLWFEKHRFRFLFALICSLVANYLTYTRASIVLVIPVLISVWLFHNRFHIRHKIMALAIVIAAIAAGQYLLVYGQNLIIVQRLLNVDSTSIVSTAEHFKQIQNSQAAIVAHPLAGVGLGSQGDFVGPQNVLVTDGGWWRLLLEFGIPLSMLLILSISIILFFIARYVLRRDSKNRALAIATLSFHAFIIPANFVNNALFGHIAFVLYWVVLGLSIAGIDYNSPLPAPLRGMSQAMQDA